VGTRSFSDAAKICKDSPSDAFGSALSRGQDGRVHAAADFLLRRMNKRVRRWATSFLFFQFFGPIARRPIIASFSIQRFRFLLTGKCGPQIKFTSLTEYGRSPFPSPFIFPPQGLKNISRRTGKRSGPNHSCASLKRKKYAHVTYFL